MFSHLTYHVQHCANNLHNYFFCTPLQCARKNVRSTKFSMPSNKPWCWLAHATRKYKARASWIWGASLIEPPSSSRPRGPRASSIQIPACTCPLTTRLTCLRIGSPASSFHAVQGSHDWNDTWPTPTLPATRKRAPGPTLGTRRAAADTQSFHKEQLTHPRPFLPWEYSSSALVDVTPNPPAKRAASGNGADHIPGLKSGEHLPGSL